MTASNTNVPHVVLAVDIIAEVERTIPHRWRTAKLSNLLNQWYDRNGSECTCPASSHDKVNAANEVHESYCPLA